MKVCRFLFLLALVFPFFTNAQEQSSVLPKVIDHAAVFYPVIARTAHVEGSVQLRLTTDGHAVTSVEVLGGPSLLARFAADNAKTWKFEDHTPGTFEVTFIFKFLEGRTTFFAEPGVVDIAVLPYRLDGDARKPFTSTPPVNWDLELKSARDDIKAPLTLWTYGPWLRGYTLGGRSREREIGEPRIDRDMTGFDVLLDDSFGQRLQFSLIGRKTGDKIQGVILDAWGNMGTWKVVPSTPPAANCPAPSPSAEQSTIPVPDISGPRDAHYPSPAWEARIQGQVRMRVTADAYCAAKITLESSDPVLAQSAEANVRSWMFADHKPGTFDLTFNYRILKPEVAFLEKPGLVELSAVPRSFLEGPESGLGNSGGFSPEIWKAQLVSRGKHIPVAFRFKYGCCEGGKATDANGKSEEIMQGFRLSDNVGFSTIVRLANGRRTRVSLIGRLKGGDRMHGVFLDEFGNSGTWSATMISHGHVNTYE